MFVPGGAAKCPDDKIGGAQDSLLRGVATRVATRLEQARSIPSSPKARRFGSGKLMAAIRQKGYSRRRSRRALHAVLKAWIEALARYEPVEVGVGQLVVVYVRQRRKLSLRKIVDVPRYPLTVKLELPRGSRRRLGPDNRRL